jgi:hypothetical protein
VSSLGHDPVHADAPLDRRPSRLVPPPRLDRLSARLGIDFDRAAAAHHEAGHAIAGFWFGWTIGGNGVVIDERQCCHFACARYTYTPEARAVVAMAGWLAERKWHRQGSSNWDDELIHILDAHAWGQIIVGDDEQQVVCALAGPRQPDDIGTSEFLAAVHAFRGEAAALLSRRPVWRAVRSVARALLQKGKLSDDDVINCISDADFMQVSHGRWAALGGQV